MAHSVHSVPFLPPPNMLPKFKKSITLYDDGAKRATADCIDTAAPDTNGKLNKLINPNDDSSLPTTVYRRDRTILDEKANLSISTMRHDDLARRNMPCKTRKQSLTQGEKLLREEKSHAWREC